LEKQKWGADASDEKKTPVNNSTGTRFREPLPENMGAPLLGRPFNFSKKGGAKKGGE
jgi:hypothetical protein